MKANVGSRLTRAQAEGVLYKLPEDESSKAFAEQVRSLRHEPGVLLEVLHQAQESFGYLPKTVLGWIAQELKIPREEVYETATFYSLFALKPEAKHVIRVCDCLPCYLQRGEAVLAAIRNAAGIPPGETSSQNGLFSLYTVSCLGLCDQAPAMMINRERYGLLTPEKVHQVIADVRRQERIKEGHRQND